MSSPPTKYVRYSNFTAFSAGHPEDQQPGVDMDGEFDRIKATGDATIDRLALIQRDDGALRNLIVTSDSLASNVRALFTAIGVVPRGAWLTGTVYAVKDVVNQTSGTYMILTAHVSGVFATDLAAGKLMVISNALVDQLLNTTNSPTFAGLGVAVNTTIGGRLSVGSVATIADLNADTNFGRTRIQGRILPPTTNFPFFSVPLSLDNFTNHLKYKISASVALPDVNSGYANHYVEGVIEFGSNGGVYKAPTTQKLLEYKSSLNAAVISLDVAMVATITPNSLFAKINLASTGSLGFTNAYVFAQVETLGVNYTVSPIAM